MGTVLWINLHTLFTTDRHFLGRVKKVIMLAMQLKMVTKIELQVWEYISGDDYHFYQCVPFWLFLEHIAPCLRKNPHGVIITYNSCFTLEDDEQQELVLD